MAKQYSVREMQVIFKKAGYSITRISGGHQIWKKDAFTIALPTSKLNFKVGTKIYNQIVKNDAH